MPNEKILVVDDDTNICELLRLYLEKEGYVVKIVNDGVSAINAFKQKILGQADNYAHRQGRDL